MSNQHHLHLILVVLFQYNLGDLIDTVKTAAEGVKSHSSSVATWMKNSVSPTLRNILPASPGPALRELQPQPSTSAAMWAERPVSNNFLGIIVNKLKCWCIDVILFSVKHVSNVFTLRLLKDALWMIHLLLPQQLWSGSHPNLVILSFKCITLYYYRPYRCWES